MSDWEVVTGAPQRQSAPMQSDWSLSAPEQEESFGQAALYTVPRIGLDLLNSAYQGAQKIPDYWEKAKTEVPGFFNPKNWLMHPIDRGGQTLAGLLGLGQKINHAPRTAAQYAANRLHLIPQEWANKVPQAPDLNEDIEKYIGQPKNPGDSLSRGLARNADLLLAGNALGKAMPHLTKRGASKKLRESRKLGAERNMGQLNINPELIEDTRQFLPNDLYHRNLLDKANAGDYQELFNLQSSVGKASRARSGKAASLFSPESALKGRAGFKSQNALLNDMHRAITEKGHLDISDLMREGRNDFRRYSKFKPYRNALGVAAGAYMLPKNALIDLAKKLFFHRGE